MVGDQAQFHGTQDETRELMEAIARNCECQFDEAGAVVNLCHPHKMLLTDQRALDGMLVMRVNRHYLLREEGIDGCAR
jgi:hypothetical protein